MAAESVIKRASATKNSPPWKTISMSNFCNGRFPGSTCAGKDFAKFVDRSVKGVTFNCIDIRKEVPEDLFHIVFCRNLAFTYFDTGLQQSILQRLYETIAPEGFLLPVHMNGFL